MEKAGITRREFLRQSLAAGLAGAAVLHGASIALSDAGESEASEKASILPGDASDTEFVFQRLKFKDFATNKKRWDINPAGDDLFLEFLKNSTNVRVSTKPFRDRVVALDELGSSVAQSDRTTRATIHPFLFMTGLSNFSFTDKQGEAIGNHIRQGGFLYADDCNGDKCQLYSAFLRESMKILPGIALQKVPSDHPIYQCFYSLLCAAPSTYGPTQPDMGLFYEDRLAVFLTAGDLHCSWAHQYLNGGPVRSEQANDCMKMGVNIVLYALTH